MHPRSASESREILIKSLNILREFANEMHAFKDASIDVTTYQAKNTASLQELLKLTDKLSIEKLLKKFHLGTHKNYGPNSLDLSVLTKHTEDEIIDFIDEKTASPDQLLNIIVKVVNHFRLHNIFMEMKNSSLKERLLFLQIEKYSNNDKEKRYTHSLEIYRVMSEGIQIPLENITLTIPGHPEDKLITGKRYLGIKTHKDIVRLHTFKYGHSTPHERKYNVKFSEKRTKTFHIIGSYYIQNRRNKYHPNYMYGPAVLGPMVNKSDLSKWINSYHLGAVVSIEEKMVAERYFKHHKASRHDWLKHGLTVCQIEAPDFAAMSYERTLIASAALVQAVQEAQRHGKNTYIHCKSGVSRSATILLMTYIIHGEKILPANDTFLAFLNNIIYDNLNNKIDNHKLLLKDVNKIFNHLKQFRYINLSKVQKGILAEGLNIHLKKLRKDFQKNTNYINTLRDKINALDKYNDLAATLQDPLNELKKLFLRNLI